VFSSATSFALVSPPSRVGLAGAAGSADAGTAPGVAAPRLAAPRLAAPVLPAATGATATGRLACGYMYRTAESQPNNSSPVRITARMTLR
jgi:hypothetical protein